MPSIYETLPKKSSPIYALSDASQTAQATERMLCRQFCISRPYARLIAELQGYHV